MAYTIKQPKFKTFSKYDFVKSYIATAKEKGEEIKIEKEQEAALIADAIEETQGVIFENLVTKEELQLTKEELQKELKTLDVNFTKELKVLDSNFRKELKNLEYGLIIKLTTIIVALLTLLPLINDFIRHLFKL